MIYFDSDMSKSTNMVVYFDWKKVIYIYSTTSSCESLRVFYRWPEKAVVTYILHTGLWCLTPLLTIFRLYRGVQFFW